MSTNKGSVKLMRRRHVVMRWTPCLVTACCSMIRVTEARHPWLTTTVNQHPSTPFHRQPLFSHPQHNPAHQSHRLPPSILLLRGGASSSTSSSTNKKKSGKTKNKSGKAATKKKKQAKTKSSSSKDEIASVLQEDAASAMGDAIRNRADQLLQSSTTTGEDNTPINKKTNPLVDQIDQTVSSVGWALGASDRFSTLLQNNEDDDGDATTTTMIDEETGGVETSTTAVLVHYFLKSHGGAHAVQCLCSLVATITGVLAILWPFIIPTQSSASSFVVLGQTLLHRCMLFAMMKHVSGLLAASVATAKAIPQVGLRNARLWIHDLVQDPVSQYVFYTASVLWWLRTSTASSSRWWQSWKTLPLVVAGPVVLREWISTMLVISDVLVLWVCTNHKDEDKGAAIAVVQSFLKIGQKAMDALMSLLVTPTVWRPATAAQRQAILAKLTSRTSLLLEVLVGLFMTADFVVLAMQKFVATSSTSSTAPISFMTILKVGLCAQLYLQFLWVRRRKIYKVATKIRGGAAQFPMYVLDILLDPVAAMGLGNKENAASVKPSSTTIESSSEKTEWTLKDYLVTGLGLD